MSQHVVDLAMGLCLVTNSFFVILKTEALILHACHTSMTSMLLYTIYHKLIHYASNDQ